MKNTKAIVLSGLSIAIATSQAHAVLNVGDIVLDANNIQWQYVGAWSVGDGPLWTTNPPVYSGIEAAALLFGGSPADYAISVDEAIVTHTAFLDGWSDIQYLTNAQPENWSYDEGNPGYNDPSGLSTAYSAYVQDHSAAGDPAFRNYAFVQVPEPSSLALLGVAGLVIARRRRG